MNGRSLFIVMAAAAAAHAPLRAQVSTPLAPEGTAEVVSRLRLTGVSIGAYYACGIARDRQAVCWGRNDYGQLGSGPVTAGPRGPARVADGLRFEQLAAGATHTCGVTVESEVYCWGLNLDGQIGNGARDTCQGTPCATSPVRVLADRRFDAVTVGFAHTCALSGGQAWCWGSNSRGALGAATRTACSGAPCSLRPVPVDGGRRFRSLSAGGEHTCGVSGKAVYCWGDNTDDVLGIGAAVAMTVHPAEVPRARQFVAVRTSALSTCARDVDGSESCWGGSARLASAARDSTMVARHR